MFPRREIKWIGYEETQKQLSCLKQEVELAEKKLKNGKKIFYEISRRNVSKLPSQSKEPMVSSENINLKQSIQPSPFLKETLPFTPQISNAYIHKISNHQTVPKEIYTTSEDEPNLMPFKYPSTEPLGFENGLFKGSFYSSSKLSSSKDSLSTSDSRHSSSGGTSSLIEKTYKDAGVAFKRHEVGPTAKPPNISLSVSSLASDEDTLFAKKKIQLKEKSQIHNMGDIGMEWKEVSSMNPVVLRTRFKLDIPKLQDIIEKQKIRQKQYELQIEDEFSSSFEQSDVPKFKAKEKHQSSKVVSEQIDSKSEAKEKHQPSKAVSERIDSKFETKDELQSSKVVLEQIDSAPIRKVCPVKTSPRYYQGFSAPPKILGTNKRWRKQRNKHTIVQSHVPKNSSFNGPKRIKTVTKCQSDFVTNSHWSDKKDVENRGFDLSPTHNEKPSTTPDQKSPIHDDKSPETPDEKSSEAITENEDKENDIKVDIRSILKESQLSSDESDHAKDETFSKDVDFEMTEKTDMQSTIQKENKNPLFHKTAKRKAKKSPEKKVPSPKIKHYDVDEIRKFMKKKKEERKKRHQDEHRKRMLESQKKKEGLEKLLEYQKQNTKTVAKGTSVSPTKENLSPQKESKKEHLRNLKNKPTFKEDSSAQQSVFAPVNDVLLSENFFIKKHVDSETKEVSAKNESNLIKSHKRKQGSTHIDAHIRKSTSVSVTPAPSKAAHMTPFVETSVEENKIKKTGSNKSPIKPSVAESLNNKIDEQNELGQNLKDVEMVEIDDSATYKVVDMFRSISSVSTPSNISHLIDADAGSLTEFRNTDVKLPKKKPQIDDSLKDLIKTINMMTKPLEPFLRTKKWIEDNPPPPVPFNPKESSRNTDLFNQPPDFPKKNSSSHLEKSKTEDSKINSFRECISGIGDVSELYAQIMKPIKSVEQKPTLVSEQGQDVLVEDKFEDELIEGSIASADDYIIEESQIEPGINHQSEESNNSSHFSDYQKAHVVPDPFNFINTWTRKPLDFATINKDDQKAKHLSDAPENSIPLKDLYKSLLESSADEESEHVESKVTAVSQSSFVSPSLKLSSVASHPLSEHHTISKSVISGEISSRMSNSNSFEESQSLKSFTSHKDLPAHSLSEKKSLGKKKSHTSSASVKDSNNNRRSVSSVESGSQLVSPKSIAKFSEKDSILAKPLHQSNSGIKSIMSEMAVSGTIYSEYSLDADQSGSQLMSPKSIAEVSEKDSTASNLLQESNSGIKNMSETAVSGTIYSEYSLNVDTDGSQETLGANVSKKEEFNAEDVPDRASASGSSISEVISVVENSKGFKSSEDLLSDQSTPLSRHSDVPSHISMDDKASVHGSMSLQTISNRNAELQSIQSQKLKKSVSSALSNLSPKESKHSALLLKPDQMLNIRSASQNSVTIDLRHPLKLRVSNGESLQANHELDLQNDQPIHPQLDARVENVAKAAVIATFETQKILLGKKKYMELINPYGRSSSKRTQYSSDFESSEAPKSSSLSPEYSAADNKNSRLIPESISSNSNNNVSSQNGSLEEQIISEHSNGSVQESINIEHSNGSVQENINSEHSNGSIEENINSKHSSGSVQENINSEHYKRSVDEKINLGRLNQEQISQIKSFQSTTSSEGIVPVSSEGVINRSHKTYQRSKRKISGNLSSPSPASLSDNESRSSETLMSSCSNFSRLSESIFSDDSFAKQVVQRITYEEELQAKQQLQKLRIDEKNLVEKARSKMSWLELLKKKCKKEGAEKKVSAIKRKQKEIILILRQKRAHLQLMQESCRNICEKHRPLSKEEKSLFKESKSLLTYEKSHTSKETDSKVKDFPKQRSSSSSSSVVSDNDMKTMVEEESVSEVPEVMKSFASNSSQESILETQASELVKTSNSSLNKSQQNSPNPPFSPLNAAESISNPSLHSNHSLEMTLQGLKKLEASKRHLNKREQRIHQRRKQAENLLQLQKKLDNEEKEVRELEQKALEIVDHSKKRTKYYVSSSGSTNQDDVIQKSTTHESKSSTEIPSEPSKLSRDSTASESEKKSSQTNSDESIPTNLSENGLEDHVSSDKDNAGHSSAAPSSSLIEEIKSSNGESSIPTVEATENGSAVEEVISEASYHVSPSVKNKSSSSDIYSESFESTTSRKSISLLSHSSPLKNSSGSRSIKKDQGIGIRLPLVPRNMRRHDSSGSDDSYTVSQSETASDQSDIEVRIHALTEELKRRKAEAEKLKREQKKKYKERLKEKEASLKKQLEAYDNYINQATLELEHHIEAAISPPQTSEVVVKPQIKWPRPEKVIESRRVRKQHSISPDTLALEKKSEYISKGPENAENLASTSKEREKSARKLFPDPIVKADDEKTYKEASDKSAEDSKEISEALSNNSSEIQEISDIEQTKSVSSEVLSEIKGVSDSVENSTNSLFKTQKLDEIKSSESPQKQSSASFTIEENKSSNDTIESQSQTDTFITISSSSRSSEPNNSQQIDESNSSNQAASSEDELSTKIIKGTSEDDTQKSDAQNSLDDSQKYSSPEDSMSEIPSVINSASFVEDFSIESLSKNLNSNSSGNNEAPPKNEVTDLESKHQPLHKEIAEPNELIASVELQSPAKEAVDHLRKVPTETRIVNIVNYLYSTLVDDAFQIVNKIAKEKYLLASLNTKLPKCEIPRKKVSTKGKVAETLCASLLDVYLEDAFNYLFKNINSLKNNASINVNFLSTEASSMQAIASTSLLNTLTNNTAVAIETGETFSVSQTTQDINQNQIFGKSVDWAVDNVVTSPGDQQIQQPNQQVMFQQYSYFYRKIPNKPPPPYTPPSMEFPFVKEKPKEKVTTVEEVNKHIDPILEHAVELLLDEKQKGVTFSCVTLPSNDPISTNLELTATHQSVFIDLVFNLTKEVILEKYSETKQIPQPWIRPHKLRPKSLLPSSKETIISSIKKEMKKALKINEDPSSAYQRKQISWSSLKLGRKKRDFVDTILISELKEEEPSWVNYDEDEMTIKLQIADSIFSYLITDTVNVFRDLDLKINR